MAIFENISSSRPGYDPRLDREYMNTYYPNHQPYTEITTLPVQKQYSNKLESIKELIKKNDENTLKQIKDLLNE